MTDPTRDALRTVADWYDEYGDFLFEGRPTPPFPIAVVRAALATAPDGSRDLDQAWAEAVTVTPKGWIFHGVELEDNSMDGGDWGPGWVASISWPGHCHYDDCDHDDAFRIGKGATPLAALRALVDDCDWTAMPEPYDDGDHSFSETVP